MWYNPCPDTFLYWCRFPGGAGSPPWPPQCWDKGSLPSLKESASQIICKSNAFDDPLHIFVPSFYWMTQYRREFFFSERIYCSKSSRLPMFWLWHPHSAHPALYSLCLTTIDAWFLPILTWKEKRFNRPFFFFFQVESGDLEANGKDQLHITSHNSCRYSPASLSHQGSRTPTGSRQNHFKAQQIKCYGWENFHWDELLVIFSFPMLTI